MNNLSILLGTDVAPERQSRLNQVGRANGHTVKPHGSQAISGAFSQALRSCVSTASWSYARALLALMTALIVPAELAAQIEVTSGGDVGIGTATPDGKFHLTTSSPASGTYVRAGSGSYGVLEVGVPNSVNGKSFLSLHRGGAVMHQMGISGSDLVFAVGGGSNSLDLQSETLRITSGGNVGIGTSSPAFALDVASTSSRLASNTTFGGITLEEQAYPNRGALLFSTDRTGYTFFIGNKRTSDGNILPIITMYDEGYVGIGITPSYKFHVNGTTVAGNFTSLGYWANTGAGYGLIPGEGWAWFAGNQDNSSAVLYVQSLSTTGTRELVSFGTTGGVGSITTDGSSTSYNTSSDARLKTNIRPLTNSGAVIDALQPRVFDWKSGEKDAVGFIAQELHQTAPYAVTAGDDDPEAIAYQWAVDASKLVPVLTAEVKALRARVANIESERAADREALAALRRELAALNSR